MQVSAEVVEVNLLDRIEQRLSDTRAGINPHDFEDCATSLLSPMHPGLVPFTGGSDFGLDAEITEDSRITGLIITSSRNWDGAKRSLRDSLRSMIARKFRELKEQPPGTAAPGAPDPIKQIERLAAFAIWGP